MPADEDDEATRWAKLIGLRHGGEGMGSLIWDATRPRNPDASDTRALVRDRFNPWRR